MAGVELVEPLLQFGAPLFAQLRQRSATAAPTTAAAAADAAAERRAGRQPELLAQRGQRFRPLRRRRVLDVAREGHRLDDAAVLLERKQLLVIHVAAVVAEGARRRV